jgi:virulence factor Mce-like protein
VRRRGSASIAANPVLIGAATTLVVLVAVFLAYNANNGLPFVPSYTLKAQVPNAANLVVGNDVRLGGTRVGAVTKIEPRNGAGGSVSALLTLKLETTIKPLPVDTAVVIRSRSALGLKYVELTKGTNRQGFEDGATIPVRNATPEPVEIDDVLNTFDARTRAAIQTNLEGFGDAFAGRGQDLNLAIEALNPLLVDLTPVMRNLASPRTGLKRLVGALGRTSRELAPVAEQQAALFRNMATTFGALEAVSSDLQQSIVEGPPALEAGINGFPRQRPFLRNSAGFFHDLRPGVASLDPAAGDLADALTVGTPTLDRSVAFNQRLIPAFRALQAFAEDPLAQLGISDLTTFAEIAEPTIKFLEPVQTVCNYATLFLRNTASLLSTGGKTGTTQRFAIVATPQGPNNEGSPASAPANGPGTNYLHSNLYPNTVSPGQTKECEAGNEPWLAVRKVVGNVPGNQGTVTEKTKRSASLR